MFARCFKYWGFAEPTEAMITTCVKNNLFTDFSVCIEMMLGILSRMNKNSSRFQFSTKQHEQQELTLQRLNKHYNHQTYYKQSIRYD